MVIFHQRQELCAFHLVEIYNKAFAASYFSQILGSV